MGITPTEKNYLLEFIREELENNQKAAAEIRKKSAANNWGE